MNNITSYPFQNYDSFMFYKFLRFSDDRKPSFSRIRYPLVNRNVEGVANYRLKSNRSGQTDRSISRTSNDLTLKVEEV